MWMKGNGWIIIGVVISGIFAIISTHSVEADVHSNDRALIIVSGHGGYSDDGMEKASFFYNYLKDEGYGDDQIIFLGNILKNNVDQIADICNVESALLSLMEDCTGTSDVIIYIYDHEKLIESNASFLFEDGNLTASYIVSMIDDIEFHCMNIFLTGERSSLSGPIFQNFNRDIYCSMGCEQEFSPDNFNITRSLLDIISDMNSDGEITFYEAFLREADLLQTYGQYPEKW